VHAWIGFINDACTARGNITQHSYDALGRLTETSHDPSIINAKVLYAYDANDRLITLTDPNENVTVYAYDKFNRLIRTTYADLQVETFQYDAVDNVVEHCAPGGLATSTEYDGAGRPMVQTHSKLGGREDPGQIAYRYDGLGRVTEARNTASTVTRTYDTLGLPVSEMVYVGGQSCGTISRMYNGKGQLTSIHLPGVSHTLAYERNADGLATGVAVNSTDLADFDYLGARPNLRTLRNGTSLVGSTAIEYEETGLRPHIIQHEDDASAEVDTREYWWDNAYNLDEYTIAGNLLATVDPVDLNYDGLNRLDPASIDAGWSLDPAGNRTGGGYEFEGEDQDMHRYTTVNGLPQYYDPQGALAAELVDSSHLNFYRYDANNRLDFFRNNDMNNTASLGAAFNPLDLADGHWTELSGTWSVNDNGTGSDPSDDYLEETSSGIGTILYAPETLPQYGFTFRYRSQHDPKDADGDEIDEEFSGDDNPSKYYAQALLSVDKSNPSSYPYTALRIEPDRLSVIRYEGTEIEEIDSVEVKTEKNTWYTVKYWYVSGGPEDNTVSIVRFRNTPNDMQGDAVSMLSNIPYDTPDPTSIGFTVGELAKYQFQLVEYAPMPDVSTIYVDWTYDALGRRVAQTVYNSENKGVDQTLYVWDGWRLVAELDGRHNNAIVTEYVPGPTYIDDTVAMRRDANRDGVFGEDDGFLYFLADQQYSTVALLDANGEVVERYDYDAFGMPAFYDGAGAGISGDDAKNKRLYTGREYLIAGLYDYRQRIYDSARGRFLIPDPVYDPANLGNPYTYVGNNPGAFVDPYGDFADYVWDAASIGLGAASFGYNISQGSYLSAVVDAVGIGLDVAAFAIPILPGGAGVGLKVYRAADVAVNAGQATAAAIDTGVAISEGDYTGAALAVTGTVLQGAHAGVRVGQVKAAKAVKAADAPSRMKAKILVRMEKGRDFDKVRSKAYPYCEVYVKGKYKRLKRLDGYDPDIGEIVSRKHTQLSAIQERTAMRYIREIPRKYPRGAVIADVPTTRRVGLAGDVLQGDYFLEVPVQRMPIPQSVLDCAEKLKVKIRDITGHEH